MPSPTWDKLGQQKRERIVAVAAAEFAEHGYAAGSMNVIARNAGVAKGSLFQYFDDKTDLFGFVHVTHARQLRERMEVHLRVLLADGRPALDVLADASYEFIEYHRAHPAMAAMLRATAFESQADMRAMLRHVVDEHAIQLVNLVIEAAVANDELKPGVSTKSLAASIHLLFLQLGLAGVSPEQNPWIPLDTLEGSALRMALAEFFAPLQSYYGATN